MRYAIIVSYDGSGYHGWQTQPGKKTVQSVVESAIEKITKDKINLHASGRTDSGVSALKQVAHFDSAVQLDRKFVGYINSLLPLDIRVLGIQQVGEGFHARYDVKKKTYAYRFYVSDIDIPLYEKSATRISNVDISVMKKEMAALLGKHDFTSFCASNTSVEDKVREIYAVKLKASEGMYEFEISGSGFLYNMVRIIAGTLFEIGCGKKGNLAQIITGKDRSLAGKTAPAKGLFLKDVQYKNLRW